ncbi:MAG: translation initiation factor [Chloroflexi bacterium]|jgi:translation initiation factor IF-2|nr:translation initiation factor [Chloroflexota bacterium]
MAGQRPGGGGGRSFGKRPGGRGGARPGGRGGQRGPATTAVLDGRSEVQVPSDRPTSVELPTVMTVKELADILVIEPVQVMKLLIKNGMMATINQEIDFDTAAIVAAELGVEAQEQKLVAPETADQPEADSHTLIEEEDQTKLKPRPPVVTIMGHVDHGKTSLLDAIRQTNVVAGEAGGITQHIGAYQVEKNGKKITFLDTPGHQAFTAMRARGAQVTDVVIIVVAADDGVMPQTREAIAHARAANVPIIVAINKIDAPGANPEHVKQELAEVGVQVEQYGGDVVSVEVSAKKKLHIEDLLDMVLLVTEIQDLKANPDRPAVGTVVEARLDRMKGSMCTVLVRAGTLKVGDVIVVGSVFGKVRAMYNDRGKTLKSAGPSFPAEILGLLDVPAAGDTLQAFNDERFARSLAAERAREKRAESLQPTKKLGLADLSNFIQAGQMKELNIVLKGDVKGSIEAVKGELEKLSTDTVKVRVLLADTGAVTESDIQLASASRAIVIGFNVRLDPSARRAADVADVDIRFYDIIYKLTEDIEAALRGMLDPVFHEVVTGHAEVLQVFPASKTEKAAGSRIVDGTVHRGDNVRLLRKEKVVHEGRISSLRRGRDDVKEVNTGFECGILLEQYNDFEVGDVLETWVREKVV